jgi:hypothetical protein
MFPSCVVYSVSPHYTLLTYLSAWLLAWSVSCGSKLSKYSVVGKSLFRVSPTLDIKRRWVFIPVKNRRSIIINQLS